MFAIVQTLINVFVRLFNLLAWLWQWLSYFVMQVWSAAMYVVQLVINVIAQLGAFVMTVISDVLIFLLVLATSILPPMPTGPGLQGGVSLGQLNRYLPISEVGSIAVVWGVIFGGIGLYKLAKFIRGAG